MENFEKQFSPLNLPEKPESNIESRAEKEKKLNVSMGFLFNCRTVDGLAEKLNLATKEGKLDSVMLDEYDLSIEEVNANLQRISGMAKEKMVDIILAADNKHRRQGDKFERISWDIRKEEIKSSGAVLLDEGITAEEINDSVGYYFGKDGNIYAFPKTWVHPIHSIPGTKTAVVICGEIGYLTPEQLEDLDINVIYNPSRERDDPFLKYRMLGLSDPNMTDEEIHAELMKNETFKELAEGEEEQKQNYQEWFKKIKAIIKEQKDNPSNYVRDVNETLTRKGITVIRSDGEKTSGILNPSPKMKIGELRYQEGYARMAVSVDKE
ncbi:hypothetical protein C4587_01505 [Candidatus Parcubacteria bacterium]|nr:MAG: hypothetical protein C4587_01505 [Candidatus Parcubacteria bacterium]